MEGRLYLIPVAWTEIICTQEVECLLWIQMDETISIEAGLDLQQFKRKRITGKRVL